MSHRRGRFWMALAAAAAVFGWAGGAAACDTEANGHERMTSTAVLPAAAATTAHSQSCQKGRSVLECPWISGDPADW